MRSEIKMYIMILPVQLVSISNQTAVPVLGNGCVLPSCWNKWPELIVLMLGIIFISLIYCYVTTCGCFGFIQVLFHCFFLCITLALLLDIHDFRRRDQKSETLNSYVWNKIMWDKTQSSLPLHPEIQSTSTTSLENKYEANILDKNVTEY
jgi:hypothetical protein